MDLLIAFSLGYSQRARMNGNKPYVWYLSFINTVAASTYARTIDAAEQNNRGCVELWILLR